jgi:hypothetical protein
LVGAPAAFDDWEGEVVEHEERRTAEDIAAATAARDRMEKRMAD